MEKFQISVKNLNNLWIFIEIYAVFVLNLCGENLCGEKMTIMRSAALVLSLSALGSVSVGLRLARGAHRV